MGLALPGSSSFTETRAQEWVEKQKAAGEGTVPVCSLIHRDTGTGGGGESRRRRGRGQYLSVMKLSVHIDLSLGDEAGQVWDRVGDIYEEIHRPQCGWGPGLHPLRATWVLSHRGREGVDGGKERTVATLWRNRTTAHLGEEARALEVWVGREGRGLRRAVGREEAHRHWAW